MEDWLTLENAVALGVVWMSVKGTITLLLMLGAGRFLKRTRFRPLVERLEARLPHRPRLRLPRLTAPWRRRDPGDRG
ncbi:MAG: hypothetical protein IT307_05125 [Chloroflexi bacterium]|nr:hypothetical protein [Chloroflexota bacterium]